MRLLLLLAFVLASGTAYAEEADGLASALVSSQNTDGSWGTSDKGLESKIYITAKALEGLVYHGGEPDAVSKGVGWIETQNPGDTAALAGVLKVLELSGNAGDLEASKLMGYQNADGGWGKTAGFESTSWYTSSAVVSLLPLEGGLDAGVKGGGYLLNAQGRGGDFEGSAMITSNCVYALALLYDATKRDEFAIAAARGFAWLDDNRGPDGVWDSTASTSNTVIALGALYGLFGSDDVKAVHDNASTWVTASVQGRVDALSTALALAALTLEVDVSPAVQKPAISSQLSEDFVFPGDHVQITFRVTNGGLGDLKNVGLVLVVPDGLGAEIEKTDWEVDVLESGSSRDFAQDIHIGGGALEGEYPLMIKGDSFGSVSTLHVLKPPFAFTVSPAELKNEAPTEFTVQIANTGDMDFTISGVLGEFDGDWRNITEKSVDLEVPAGSVESALLFSAITPRESGEYSIPITVKFANPTVGERQVTFRQKFLVGGGVPSGVLKLVLYGTLVLSVMMLLNLLAGYDLVG